VLHQAASIAIAPEIVNRAYMHPANALSVHFDADGGQRATSPNGALTWQLSPGKTGDAR
jgi:hypothetical protein